VGEEKLSCDEAKDASPNREDIAFCYNPIKIFVMNNQSAKDILIKKLLDQKSFWSFEMPDTQQVPDDILIEKTFLYLDIEDINLLFKIYPIKSIKQVWIDRLVVQGSYYARLNKLIAWMYFDIKQPERYLKRIENRQLKIV
jgi:hypothetical protein